MFASYKSSLRVYEPIWAFEPAARAKWARYRTVADQAGSLDRERSAMLHAVLGGRVDFARIEGSDDALLAEWDGNRLVCPLDTHSRALQAIVDSEWSLPFPLNELVIGRSVRRQAAGRQLRPRAGGRRDGAKAHVLTASWDVPFWWSLMFSAADAVPTEELDALRYRTSISTARSRAENALELISQTFGVTPFSSDLDAVVTWLRTFDADAMVELDYGSLGALVTTLSSEGDDSMSLASTAIDELRAGRLEAAIGAYQEYISTWEEVGRLESWN